MPKITISMLYTQLNDANKAFNEQIEKDKEISNEYLEIKNRYQKIINSIKNSKKNLSPLRKILVFEARFMIIQCHLNAFPLYPTSEQKLKENDKKFSSLQRQLAQLNNKIAQLKNDPVFAKKKSKGLSKIRTLLAKIKRYQKQFRTKKQYLQAVYYYNFAGDLQKSALHLQTLAKLKMLKKALIFLEKSADFYAAIAMHKEKAETEPEISQLKKQLAQLEYSEGWAVNLAKLQEKIQEESLAIDTSSLAAISTPNELKSVIAESLSDNLSPPINPPAAVLAENVDIHELPEEIVIKQEQPIVQSDTLSHKINNALPILQNPNDLSCSLLPQVERPIDEIKITHWGSLHEIFYTLPKKEVFSIKQTIIAEIREWLGSEGNHAQKLLELMEPSVPIDDGPDRGMSVYAKRNIRQFEVIGPYSGKLHQSKRSLEQEYTQAGYHNVTTYLFGTGSAQRAVSAFGSGNILSLINTANPIALSEGTTTKAWQHNNVIPIRAGNNLTFYIAVEDISKDTELLVDYGPDYSLAQSETEQNSVDQAAILEAPPAKKSKSDKPVLDENHSRLEEEALKSIAASLEKKLPNDDNAYFLLFAEMSKLIPIHSDYNSLARLRFKEILLYFLSSNTTSNELLILQNRSKIEATYQEIFARNPDFATQRFPIPQLQSSTSENKIDLRSLFLSEIKNYYILKKTTHQDNEPSENLFKEISDIVEGSIENAVETFSINRVSDCLNKLPFISYNYFPNFLNILPSLLDNAENGKSALSEKHISIGQTLRLSYTSLFKELIESLPTKKLSPKINFFKPSNTEIASKAELIAILNENLRDIKNKYKLPSTIFLPICEDFIQMLNNQFIQLSLNIHTIMKPK